MKKHRSDGDGNSKGCVTELTVVVNVKAVGPCNVSIVLSVISSATN